MLSPVVSNVLPAVDFATVGGFPLLWREYDHLPAAVAPYLPTAHHMDELAQRATDRPTLAHGPRLADAIGEYLRPFEPPPEVVENAHRLAEPGTVAVVTGQQPVLLGGPGYVLFKALTAIRLAAGLRTRGVSAVPVFWNASEDHDLAEANAAFARHGDEAGASWKRITLDGMPAFTRHPLAEVPLPAGADLPDQLAGDTFASWQTRAMLAALGHLGLVVVEPRVLRPFAVPVLQAAFARHDQLVQQLDDTIAALAPHVPGIGGFRQQHALLFYLADTPSGPERRRLLRTANGFQVEDGADDVAAGAVSADNWSQLAATHPHRFSPNALLRPVFQNAALPTVAYVAGPAELAYNALGVPWHRSLGVPPAALVRRLSATVAPAGCQPQVIAALQARARARVASTELGPADRALRDRLSTAVAALDASPTAAAVRQTLDRFTHAVHRRLARARQSRADRSVAWLADVPDEVTAGMSIVEPLPGRLQERTLPWRELATRESIDRWLAAIPVLPGEHLILDA